jgi:FtsZ-interacting cell division protein ZipA
MAELRWILLVAGLVFLAALAVWEKRKPRQAHRDADVRAPARNEPDLGTIIEPAASSRPMGMDDGRRPVMAPLCVDLPTMEAIRDESMMAEVDALPVFEYHPSRDAATEPAVPASATLEPGQPEPVADEPSLLPPTQDAAPMVDWPPDGQRQIVALRIVAAADERLSGRAVRLAITACGFVHGRFGIFHQPDADGRALLSVASLSKPGVLDPVNMDFQRLAGISLFAVLPGPLPPAATLDHLIEVARELSQRLPARLQDEQGQPLDADRLEDLRDSMQRLSRPGMHAEPAA